MAHRTDHITDQITELKDQVIGWRRHLHMHPECGFDTKQTEHFVRSFLESNHIEILPSTVGVMGVIRANSAHGMIALRADMDALNLTEETGAPYQSQIPGRMHACGHDGHTAMLMGAAQILNAHRSELDHDILLLFQPAEEGPNLGGARIMLKDLEDAGLVPSIRSVYGQHLTTAFDTGTITLKYGSVMASTDEFTIRLIGSGGHAGYPHQAVDAISLAARFITEIESFMSRGIDPFDPAVFSIGMIQGGTMKNIIAETAELSGTIRCQSEANRARILERADRILQGIACATGAKYELDILHGLPVLVNDDGILDQAKAAAEIAVGGKQVLMSRTASMGAEDFAYFAQKIPAAYLWIGARNEGKGFTQIMHNPGFDFDEEALSVGIRMFVEFVFQSQK